MPPIAYLRQKSLQARFGTKKSGGSLRNSKKNVAKRPTKKNADYEERLVTNAPTSARGISFPGTTAAFKALVSSRFCAALWCHITDCDEVFNYWEPMHYLVYGWGLQTWEYSASAALRSYAALWGYGTPAFLLAMLAHPAPPAILYLTRCVIALSSAATDLFFYKGVCQEFGVHVGRMWLGFSLVCGGGFITSAAMLPSAWCGSLASLALAAWWKHYFSYAIVFTAISTLLGWPFAGLLGVPIAIDIIFRRKEPLLFLGWTSVCAVVILVPMVYIDSSYYGYLAVAPWNLIKYNIFTDHGPDLYGTEPWTFYFINGFLNFNIVWILALMCPLVLMTHDVIPNIKPRAAFCLPYWLSLMPFYSWLIVFMLQPHKEERFLFPIYSMICLCGAISVDGMQKIGYRYKPVLLAMINNVSIRKTKPSVLEKSDPNNHYVSQTKLLMIAVMVVATLLGVSRTVGLYKYYHAPMDILRGLAEEEVTSSGNINVCYGKEWYRFPSSFLFPDDRYRVGFVKSEFSGMMPIYYGSGEDATMLAPDHFNDMNKEDPRQYMDISLCHYFVDSTIGEPSVLEPRYADNKNWTLIKSLPFLDAAKSHRLFRAFYIPILSDYYVTYGEYQLLRNAKFKVT